MRIDRYRVLTLAGPLKFGVWLNFTLFGFVLGIAASFVIWRPGERVFSVEKTPVRYRAVLIVSEASCESTLYLTDFLKWPAMRRLVRLTDVYVEPSHGNVRGIDTNGLRSRTGARVRVLRPRQRMQLRSVPIPRAPSLLVLDDQDDLRLTWRGSPDPRERNAVVKQIQLLTTP